MYKFGNAAARGDLNDFSPSIAMSGASSSSAAPNTEAQWEAVIIGLGVGLENPKQRLESPVRDAQRLAETVKKCGLCSDPILVTDDVRLQSKSDIQNALSRAVQKMKTGSKLLVYFGGHAYDTGHDDFGIPVTSHCTDSDDDLGVHDCDDTSSLRDDCFGLTVVLPHGLQQPKELFLLEDLVIRTVAGSECGPLNVLIISAACRLEVTEDKEVAWHYQPVRACSPPDPCNNLFVPWAASAVSSGHISSLIIVKIEHGLMKPH